MKFFIAFFIMATGMAIVILLGYKFTFLESGLIGYVTMDITHSVLVLLKRYNRNDY